MFDLPDLITVWSLGAEDGLGGRTYSLPQTISARYAIKQEKFTDINGDEQVSSSVVYADSPILDSGAYVFFGESSDLVPPSSADDVRAISRIPSSTDMVKAWL